MTIDKNTKLKTICKHPIGRDVLKKILMTLGMDIQILENPLTGNLTFGALSKVTGKVLDASFYDTFIGLLNSEKDRPRETAKEPSHKWWKEAVFYQIYPRSFSDTNGDGIGDLKGMIGKLDYLKNLGVDAVWLSPVYDSPNDDNGYDIRDYYKIMEEFGTMEEFDALLSGLHERQMYLIMDLVVNHTSDEHPWFQEARRDEDSPFRDYYFFRKGEECPNNWTSFFSGSAWNYYEDREEWALHLFSKKQMDLNWENPALRRDIEKMIRWWLKKGVDGFRMDVINYISKTPGLPDGNEQIGKLMGFYGIEHYFYGPRLHEYLREIRREAFDPYHAFSVGETPGAGMEMSKLLTADYRGELDMVFSFDHLETPGHTRFEDYRYDLNYLKTYYMDWTEHYGNHCWMSLFYENHDNPRMVSKVNPEPAFREVIAKLLAIIQFTLKGTPFLYQGQELGAVNADFKNISELHDVESRNLYEELLKTMSREEAFHKVLSGTRDHARVMMDGEEAASQKKERESVYYFYKKLIALRKRYPALVYGDIKFVHKGKKNLFCYYRSDDEISFYVECNLSDQMIKRQKRPDGYGGILSNYGFHDKNRMMAYEVCLYRKKESML